MFDHAASAPQWQVELQGFISHWLLDEDLYGIEAAKLDRTLLPQPLRHFYGYAGNLGHSNHWSWPFSCQDRILPFELLEKRAGLLCFASENQWNWYCGTETAGEDPPVWCDTGAGWQELGCSLSRFLVSICLHELVYGSHYLAKFSDLDTALTWLQQAGRFVKPLLLQASYPYRPLDFHLADADYLVMTEGWVGVRKSAAVDDLRALFAAAEYVHEPVENKASAADEMVDRLESAYLLETQDFPELLKSQMLQMYAKRNRERELHHRRRAEAYENEARRCAGESAGQDALPRL